MIFCFFLLPFAVNSYVAFYVVLNSWYIMIYSLYVDVALSCYVVDTFSLRIDFLIYIYTAENFLVPCSLLHEHYVFFPILCSKIGGFLSHLLLFISWGKLYFWNDIQFADIMRQFCYVAAAFTQSFPFRTWEWTLEAQSWCCFQKLHGKILFLK